ncbi:helix-turn-helix domain-containing protein [Mycolicibacterium sphagni]|uniref:Helix-turn-helix domain-containing protein n=1 Tax=Mycolicibacterium sphagni TaxID=1786 RepID=A0A255DHQ6_9MYCO|nr:helix-turn-helix domain-containing protein [Mycolicibacterium sphagni]OYN78896.1 hypothetical protein CG716_13590 [Mycolicibacterium sphagni]
MIGPGDMLQLTGDQVAAVRYAVSDLIALRLLGNRPIPPALLALQKFLAASPRGSQTDCNEQQLEHEGLIDTAAAAEILGRTPRRVRQIRTDLDGVQISGRWVFRRKNVVEYAEAKGIGNAPNRDVEARRGGISQGAA